MDWIDSDALWLFGPELAVVCVGGEAFESLEPLGKVVGGEEVCEVCPQPVVAVVVVAANGGLFDRAVHAFDLTVGPGVVRLGEPMVDARFGASELAGMGRSDRRRVGQECVRTCGLRGERST